jgi:hypothetical protein
MGKVKQWMMEQEEILYDKIVDGQIDYDDAVLELMKLGMNKEFAIEQLEMLCTNKRLF